MDIGYCRELLELADQLNFSKAAERLYITQSTLSKHVAVVEREVGFRIFERTTSHVSLTEGGRSFLESIRDVVEKYDAALYEGRSLQKENESTVRIIGPLLNEGLMSMITVARSELVARGESVRLNLVDIGVKDYQEALLDCRADIAIGFKYESDEAGLLSEHMTTMPFGVACHGCHHLAAKESIVFEDLRGERFVSYPMAGRDRYHSYVRAVCDRYGIDYEVSYLEDGSLCFPEEDYNIVFGVYFPGYARYGGDIVSRKLDDIRDVFDVCAIRREGEKNETIIKLFEAICAHGRRIDG